MAFFGTSRLVLFINILGSSLYSSEFVEDEGELMATWAINYPPSCQW